MSEYKCECNTCKEKRLKAQLEADKARYAKSSQECKETLDEKVADVKKQYEDLRQQGATFTKADAKKDAKSSDENMCPSGCGRTKEACAKRRDEKLNQLADAMEKAFTSGAEDKRPDKHDDSIFKGIFASIPAMPKSPTEGRCLPCKLYTDAALQLNTKIRKAPSPSALIQDLDHIVAKLESCPKCNKK